MHALGDRVVRARRQRVTVLPFHERWIRAAFADDVQVAALSIPRGGAKTWLWGQLAALAMRPGSPTWEKGIETLVVSASLEQSRILLGFVREVLADVEDDYRYLDSGQRLAVTHKATGTRLRVLSSSGKRAMGLSQFSTIYGDEPGSWESRGGRAHVGRPTAVARETSWSTTGSHRHPRTVRGWFLVAFPARFR